MQQNRPILEQLGEAERFLKELLGQDEQTLRLAIMDEREIGIVAQALGSMAEVTPSQYAAALLLSIREACRLLDERLGHQLRGAVIQGHIEDIVVEDVGPLISLVEETE